MIQAPEYREYFRVLFRNLVNAAIIRLTRIFLGGSDVRFPDHCGFRVDCAVRGCRLPVVGEARLAGVVIARGGGGGGGGGGGMGGASLPGAAAAWEVAAAAWEVAEEVWAGVEEGWAARSAQSEALPAIPALTRTIAGRIATSPTRTHRRKDPPPARCLRRSARTTDRSGDDGVGGVNQLLGGEVQKGQADLDRTRRLSDASSNLHGRRQHRARKRLPPEPAGKPEILETPCSR